MFEKIFKLKSNNTSVSREILAGVTTFVTMAYIIFVNPQMMAVSGMDLGASFVGTCLAASIACIIMGIYSNWPVSLAPGMGLNAFYLYSSWRNGVFMGSCSWRGFPSRCLIFYNECYKPKKMDA